MDETTTESRTGPRVYAAESLDGQVLHLVCPCGRVMPGDDGALVLELLRRWALHSLMDCQREITSELVAVAVTISLRLDGPDLPVQVGAVLHG